MAGDPQRLASLQAVMLELLLALANRLQQARYASHPLTVRLRRGVQVQPACSP